MRGRLPHHRLHPRIRTRLNRRNHRRRVRLPTLRGGAVTVRVGGEETCPGADGVEGDLQLAVVKSTVETGDDGGHARRVCRNLEPRRRQFRPQRGFANDEQARAGHLPAQEVYHHVGSVDHVFRGSGEAEVGEFAGIIRARAGRIIGKKHRALPPRPQPGNRLPRARQQRLPQINRAIQVKNVAVV